MNLGRKASRIRLLDFSSPQMRAFHMSWLAFFLAFFGWFGIAPLMIVVRDELGLTKTQIGNTIIASVALTGFARVGIGRLCDRIGPRLAYSALLTLGSLPVMGIGLAQSYESFLLFRLAIGVIGASFVITQYHSSVMFAPNCVATANATTAGWGNLGGGVTQMLMPLVFAGLLTLGASEFLGWRLAMVVPGIALFVTGVAYYFFTQDGPDGNFSDLRARGAMPSEAFQKRDGFLLAAGDPRVWALFLLYGASFGVELTIHNVAALYYSDRFGLGLQAAGLIAGLYGAMNLFARTAGGMLSDRFARTWGLRGRVAFLGGIVFLEGLALMLFASRSALPAAIASMMVFAVFVQMANGATFGVVPFLNRRALGSVVGIVGAGGNVGAVAAGLLFRAEGISAPQALFILGACVTVCATAAALVRFSPAAEDRERLALREALSSRFSDAAA